MTTKFSEPVRLVTGTYTFADWTRPLVTPRTYEITFAGEAPPAIVEAFDDFDVTVGAGNTVLRAELPDQAALHGALDRLGALGLELLQVKPVGPPLQ